MIPDHDKIAKMIRLLDSDHAGEVNAAVAGLRRVLASNKLTMNDLAAVIEQEGKESAIHLNFFPDPDDYEFVARWCKERYNRLKRIRERQFIDDLIEKDFWKLSTKQRQWLQSIYVKLGGRI